MDERFPATDPSQLYLLRILYIDDTHNYVDRRVLLRCTYNQNPHKILDSFLGPQRFELHVDLIEKFVLQLYIPFK